MRATDLTKLQQSILWLTRGDSIKVWSYITTIFGDLAQHDGDEISGPLLSALTERIGIKPEAMRVAIHRLRKDGWIQAQKIGRVNFYQLTNMGLDETLEASRWIYAEKIDVPTAWHLAVFEPGTPPDLAAEIPRLRKNQNIQVAPGVMLGAGPAPSKQNGSLFVEFDSLEAPAWLTEALAPPGLLKTYQAFLNEISRIERQLPFDTKMSNLDSVTLRLLIIHDWRRLLLRHPPFVEYIQGDGWVGSICRRKVVKCLAVLKRPTLQELHW